MGSLIKIILETLLGGSMEKMLKNNNGMTMLNTLLLAGCMYQIHQLDDGQTKQEKEMSQIRDAMFYKLNIRTDAPDRGNFPDETHIPIPDVILSQTTPWNQERKTK